MYFFLVPGFNVHNSFSFRDVYFILHAPKKKWNIPKSTEILSTKQPIGLAVILHLDVTIRNLPIVSSLLLLVSSTYYFFCHHGLVFYAFD